MKLRNSVFIVFLIVLLNLYSEDYPLPKAIDFFQYQAQKGNAENTPDLDGIYGYPATRIRGWSITEDSNNYSNFNADIPFIEYFIKLKVKEIFNVFKKHGIIPNNDKFLKLPVKFNNNVFTPSLSLKKVRHPDFNEPVTQYSVTVKTDGNKSKIIKT